VSRDLKPYKISKANSDYSQTQAMHFVFIQEVDVEICSMC